MRDQKTLESHISVASLERVLKHPSEAQCKVEVILRGISNFLRLPTEYQ